MTTYTYTQLQTHMKSYMGDSDSEFVNQLSMLIARAEARVYGDLALDTMMVNSSVNLPTASTLVSKPVNCISVQEVRYPDDTGKLLLERTVAFLNTLRGDLDTGNPAYWAPLTSTQIVIAPRRPAGAGASDTLWIRHSAPEEQLGPSKSTTWVSRVFGDLLLDACLWEIEAYNKHSEGEQLRANDYGIRLAQAERYLEGRKRQTVRV